jgi:MYXO-CTERM domain-containing protein
VAGFEMRGGAFHALISSEARQAAPRTATVALPANARDPVWLEDDASHMRVSSSLLGAHDVAIATADGVAIYEGALPGADELQRVRAEGTEDYLVFHRRPEKEEIVYDVDVSRVAGIRLVANTLEFLDGGGAPRLRVPPPYIVDANGTRSVAVLSLGECAFDESPRAPWGRTVISPGALRCSLHVSWNAAAYPATLDPSWTATGSMTTARMAHSATLLGSGEVLLAGGFGTGDGGNFTLSSAELYDPTTGTFAATGPLTTERESSPATLLASGAVLLLGGSGMGGALSSAEIYDPAAGTFASTGLMTAARDLPTATLLSSGEVLVAGGAGNNDGGVTTNALSSAELYEPSTGTFVSTGSMTTTREIHAAALLGSGEVLVVGGLSSSFDDLSSAELYDPTAGTFAATGPMTTARNLPTATLLGSSAVLVVGGATNEGHDPLSSAELYNPASGTFTATGSMTTKRYQQTATLLGSGGVLVAGGYDRPVVAVSSAELFDPIAGAFTTTTSMTSARQLHTATLLGSGQVLAAGGGVSNLPMSSAELYTCLPTTTCPAGEDCGTIPDGCGGSVSCGTCDDGKNCFGNRCVSVLDSGSDSGAGGHDSGIHTKDSGSSGEDSGTVAGDSGAPGRKGDASDGGDDDDSTIIRGCGCRTAQRSDAPPCAPLWIVIGGIVAVRRRRVRASISSLALAALAMACGGRATSARADGGGSDARAVPDGLPVDSPALTEVGSDGGVEAGLEAGSDGGLDSGSDVEVPPSTCPGCTVLAGADDAQSLTLAPTSVYWTQGMNTPGLLPIAGTGSVKSVPRTGGPATSVASGLTGPLVVTYADSWLAWSAFTGNGAGCAPARRENIRTRRQCCRRMLAPRLPRLLLPSRPL